ncbi:MAG: AbrB family transcriptional regulator [Desulfofustis sp.]|nr:AbrB family transcriptional regulator [Desulfofustis sp.]
MALAVWVKLFLTLLIGFAGSSIAHYAGLPAAALIGSAMAVSIGSLLKMTRTLPAGFRAVAFSIIGSSLGSSLTKDFVSQAIHWPISLFILTICVVTILITCSLLLMKAFNLSAETAILATSPGAMAYSISLASEGVGDGRSIVVIQSVRLLLIITCLPFVIDYFSGSQTIQAVGPVAEPMPPMSFFVLFVLTLFLGRFFEKLRVPASYLLMGTVVSGAAHLMGLVSGRPSSAILFLGFTLTGTLIGARFSTISFLELKRLLKASLMVVFLSTTIAAFFSIVVASILSMSYGQVFVAFAPGGVEAMAAMALALDYDPAFVAVHHLYRILLLIFTLPLFLQIIKRLGHSNG